MSDNVCVALVGAGYWGKKLLPKFVSNRNSLVRVICDIHAGHRAEMNQTYPDIPTSESIDNILSDPSIAAIVLATPPATHFPLARKVINAGKHVWIEKPLALRIDEGRDLVSLVSAIRPCFSSITHFSTTPRFAKSASLLMEANSVRFTTFIHSD